VLLVSPLELLVLGRETRDRRGELSKFPGLGFVFRRKASDGGREVSKSSGNLGQGWFLWGWWIRDWRVERVREDDGFFGDSLRCKSILRDEESDKKNRIRRLQGSKCARSFQKATRQQKRGRMEGREGGQAHLLLLRWLFHSFQSALIRHMSRKRSKYRQA